MTSHAVAAIRKDVARAIRPRVRMKVSDAARRYVKVRTPSGGVSAWDAEETPYMVEPMDCLASREYEAVVFVGPARSGKTQGLLDCWAAYMIKCEPCIMQIVHMTEATARKYSRRRIDKLLRDSQDLKAEMAKGANNDNTHDKYFRAGNVLGITWPSITHLSGDDVKFIALTDYDRFPEDIGGEGNGYFLAKKRTQTFGSRGKTLVETSPGYEIIDPKWTTKPDAPHEAPPCGGALSIYNMGDRRRLYWLCPHCGQYFLVPVGLNAFSYVHNKDLLGNTVPTQYGEIGYVCQANGCIIDHREKRRLNETALWVPEGCTIENGQVVGERRKTRIASFWLSGAAAAYQNAESIIEKYLAALLDFETTGSETSLKTVTNTDIGGPYLPKRYSVDITAGDYKARAETYEKGVIPELIRFLELSFDTQGNRFEGMVTGYGIGLESLIIDRFAIYNSNRTDGDQILPINPASYAEDWDLLIEKGLNRRYQMAADSSRYMGIASMSVDTGGQKGVAKEAYDFWRRCKRTGLHRRVFLLKGDPIKQYDKQPRVKRTFPDSSERSGKEAISQGDVPLWLINSTRMKDEVDSNLRRTSDGEGYVHFPQWFEDRWYDELTAEIRLPERWDNPNNARNETWDLLHYCKANIYIKLQMESREPKIDWEHPPLWAADAEKNPYIYTEAGEVALAPRPVQAVQRRTRMRMR